MSSSWGGRANCSVIAVITDRGFEANMCDVVLGNVDGDALLDWAESCLFPGLSTNPVDRCSYLILDNCPVHYDPRFLDRLKVRTDSLGTVLRDSVVNRYIEILP